MAVGGGCGFLASYMVPELVSLGAHVTVVDNLANGDVDRLKAVAPDVAIEIGDLRDRATCDRVTRGQDVFLNLAAQAFGMEYSRTHQSAMLLDNLLVGLLPMEAAGANAVRHYLAVSSSCVYADDAPVPTPESAGSVGTPERVNEGYGWAKRMQEVAASYYVREGPMQITVARPCNLYGGRYQWRDEQKGSLVPSLVKRILDGEDPLVVWGSGRQRRNLLHASDAAHLMLRVVERSTGAEPVNIGFDNDVSIAELVARICDVTGRHPRVEFDDAKPEGAPRKSADPARLRAITGIDGPRMSLVDGIRDMVAWYHSSFPAVSHR